jgi:hypothetical protein
MIVSFHSFFLGVAVMSKRIAVAFGLVAVLALIPAAQASFFTDFEGPTYTTGAIDGQNGWASTGGGVYGAPYNLAGAQSMEPTTATTRSLAGAGFTDSTTLTALLDFYPNGSNFGEAEIYLKAGTATIVGFGVESRDTGFNIVQQDSAGWHTLASAYAGSPTLKLLAEGTLNFTAQTYDLKLTDVNNTANVWSVSGVGFAGAVTTVEANAGAQLAFYRNLPDFFVDNIGINAAAPTPEPSAIALLMTACAGLLAYAWRKRL